MRAYEWRRRSRRRKEMEAKANGRGGVKFISEPTRTKNVEESGRRGVHETKCARSITDQWTAAADLMVLSWDTQV